MHMCIHVHIYMYVHEWLYMHVHARWNLPNGHLLVVATSLVWTFFTLVRIELALAYID